MLARWRSPARGIVEPAEFIEVAEQSGQISALSMRVMEKAFVEAKDWPSELKLAVNISPIQFRDPQLAERIVKVLTETGFPARRLEVEITESSLMEDRDQALTIVQSLRNNGITIALDDFGTGYASLSQLHTLPFDRIKIDKSFISALSKDEQGAAIVETITALGKSLKVPIPPRASKRARSASNWPHSAVPMRKAGISAGPSRDSRQHEIREAFGTPRPSSGPRPPRRRKEMVVSVVATVRLLFSQRAAPSIRCSARHALAGQANSLGRKVWLAAEGKPSELKSRRSSRKEVQTGRQLGKLDRVAGTASVCVIGKRASGLVVDERSLEVPGRSSGTVDHLAAVNPLRAAQRATTQLREDGIVQIESVLRAD